MLGALLGVVTVASQSQPAAAEPITGFADSTVFTGLNFPTNIRFASDGKVFVTEKSGIIKLFSSVDDPNPTIFADLRTQTYNWWDRGLLGIALDPSWPTSPYIYVSYAYDFDPNTPGQVPRWGTPDEDSDPCPFSSGSGTDGCVSLGRVSRLTANASRTQAIAEDVLVQDFCIQFPSHSVGDVRFGPDGALYATAGEGANYLTTDTGQLGTPPNPCNDPADAGGALRSQQVRSTELTNPTSLDGALIRIDKDTGAGLSDNPLGASADPNARRIVAHGFRNPFRFAFRPGSNEAWVTDVGWATWEEINRVQLGQGSLGNYGWPCYEGDAIQGNYSSTSLCQSLYADNNATEPWFSYHHFVPVHEGENCGTADSSATGVAFYQGGSYPASYANAMFLADYARGCIWVFFAGQDGAPDVASMQLFVGNAGTPVAVEIGPGGDLFYVNIGTDGTDGEVHRVRATSANQAPRAAVAANPHTGGVPLTVQFDASGSTDPDAGDTRSYAWDFDGDGLFNDSTSATPTFTYTAAGVYIPRVRVTDGSGATSTASTVINAGGTTLPVPALGSWQFNGNGSSSDCGAQLTATAANQTGSAFYGTAVSSSELSVSFDAVIGDGAAGNGMTLAFLDASTGAGALGGGGGQMGFGGLPGAAVTLDTSQGSGEPSGNFVGVAQSTAGGQIVYTRTTTSVPTLHNATVHVDVLLTGGRIRVFVDGQAALNEPNELPPTVLVGFTAATDGGSSDRHQACNVQMAIAAAGDGHLAVAPETVSFGDVSVHGQASAYVTLSNTGASPITLSTVSLPNAPFSVDTPPVVGTAIQPGADLTLRVRFTPDVTGPASSSMTFAAGGEPTTVALSGNAVASPLPSATITTPSQSLAWRAGETINFSGAAEAADGSPLPASTMRWSIIIQHCATVQDCHTHTIQTFQGIASGSFVAPDHGYPSYIDVTLTVSDGGATSTRTAHLQPMTTTLQFDTVPSGLPIIVEAGTAPRPTPFAIAAIVGSTVEVTAPQTLVNGSSSLVFQGWSDGGAATHTVVAPAGGAGYAASYGGATCSSASSETEVPTFGTGPSTPPAGASGFVSLDPTRLFDTRRAGGEVCAGETLLAQVTGRAGVPENGVEAVALNLTAAGAQAAGYITVWPTGLARPTASAINLSPSATNANMVIIPVGATGTISLRNAHDSPAMQAVDLIADVVGYFPTGSGFNGVNPSRVLDTRNPADANAGAVAPGGQIDLQIAGRGGLPSGGVDTVVVNLTATDPESTGYVTSWPTGEKRPDASSVNFTAGSSVPNLVLARLGAGGRVSLWNSNDSVFMGRVHLIADVTGWLPGGSGYHSLVPDRILDTRRGLGAAAAAVGPGGQLDLQVTGRGGIPSSGVSAVVLNLTATNTSAPGYITTWPTGGRRPDASSLNFGSSSVANLVLAKVGPDGRISLWNSNDSPLMASADLVADVVGWFAA